MDWDDAARRWNVETVQGGELTSYPPRAAVSAAGGGVRRGRRCPPRAAVSAAGALHLPSYPDIPGAGRFGGTSFHSARWDHSCDLAGK
jgi:cation diffusion facilitator CzcD-associated flavoprotein CzcO